MQLVELIIDILEHSETPLKQGEILAIAEQHKNFSQCAELHKVQVPYSAVARCLTNYSGGSEPVFGVAFEGKNKKVKNVSFSKQKIFLKLKPFPKQSCTLIW